MKKLKFLILFALILVVGGVYATWTYAAGTVDPTEDGINVELGEKVELTKKGTLAVTSNTLKVSIEPKDGTTTYEAQAIVSGELTVAFTPSADNVDKNIVFQFALVDNTGEWAKQGETATDVFTVDTDAHQLNGGAAAAQVTITAADLAGLITATFSLPTAEHYTSFQNYINGLGTSAFTIVISEYTQP